MVKNPKIIAFDILMLFSEALPALTILILFIIYF